MTVSWLIRALTLGLLAIILPLARWSEVFLDATAAAAVIDRIVHHATVLTTAGDSYRLKVATRNQASRATQEVPRQ